MPKLTQKAIQANQSKHPETSRNLNLERTPKPPVQHVRVGREQRRVMEKQRRVRHTSLLTHLTSCIHSRNGLYETCSDISILYNILTLLHHLSYSLRPLRLITPYYEHILRQHTLLHYLQ